MWTGAGNGRITDVDKGTVGKSASICNSEDETLGSGKVDKDECGCGTFRSEGVISGTGELLVGYVGDRAEFNDAGSNGFVSGSNFYLMLVFGLIM